MKQFGLGGLAVMLLAGSVSAQTVYNVTTVKDGRGKITTFEKAAPAHLLGQMPGHGPGSMVCPPGGPCLLPDQPALLYRLALMNAFGVRPVHLGAGPVGAGPVRLDDLARPHLGEGPANLDELPRPNVLPEEKRLDEKKDDKEVVKPTLPAAMLTLTARDWSYGRTFTDECDRRWCLIKGCALPDSAKMRGWFVESDGKRQYFIHETGNIYAKVSGPVAP